MKLHMKHVLAVLAVLLPVAAARAEQPERPAALYREGEVVVRYRAGATSAEVQAAKARLGLAGKRRVDSLRTELVGLPRFTTTAAAIEVLRADPAVERAEPNVYRYRRAVIPNDTSFDQQWGLRNTGQADFSGGPAGIPGADLNMINAWDADGDGTADRTGSASVIVAVIDDAIQTTHPDLTPNLLPGRNFITCQDANDTNPVTADGQHGTLVTGCVAARGNTNSGVAGVAWNTGLLPLKFGFDTAGHMAALEYARDNGARIINASFGGPLFSQIEADLIASLAADDILYVAAAGNDDSNTDLAQLNYPANYPADNIVAVAATGREDDITSFSQYGPLSADVAAPGQQIVTTAINSSYATNPGVSGTSFSSPYTAGVAALVKAHVAPAPDYLEIKARLIESGTSIGGANPRAMTSGGRVDADAALDIADRPALVLTGVAFDAAGNDALDPGEAADVSFTVRNLWQGATNVMATLATDDADVTVNSGAQALGAIASLDDAPATFSVTVAGGITEHRYVNFTLTLTADGGYTATRNYIAELGTLTLAAEISQPFSGAIYDDYHAWHVDVPSPVGTKTLFLRTTTPSSNDIDLLLKRDVPPQYSITVGINPEVSFGFFCTSGTTLNCQDPDTLVSARQDGVEEISIVDPPAGTYHAVIVNFEQLAGPLTYTLEAEVLDGDLRPDLFNFVDQFGPSGTYESNQIMVAGIDFPTRITVAGGDYQIESNGYTNAPGTIANGERVRVRANAMSGTARVQLTIGGVTETFAVNPSTGGVGGPSEQSCEFERPGSGGGGVPLPVLVLLGLAALARRLRAA